MNLPIFQFLFLALASGLLPAETKHVLLLSGDNSHSWGQHKQLQGICFLREAPESAIG